MYEQSYSFSFEAAHELGQNVGRDPAHPYSHIHGHSFEVTVTLAAEELGEKEWITDFAKLKAACATMHERLDHRFLNEIEGLERPTMENIARYLFDALRPALPAINAVEVARPSLHERVRYRPTT